MNKTTKKPGNPSGIIVSNKTVNPVGRPSNYKPEYCQQAIELGKIGKTMVHIANAFGKTKSVLHFWMDEHPEFAEAIALSKQLNEAYWLDLADSRANGLHQGSDVLIKFMLSAAHGYREKMDVKSESSGSVTLIGSAADIIKSVANAESTNTPND
jgi:hypothetical protein